MKKDYVFIYRKTDCFRLKIFYNFQSKLPSEVVMLEKDKDVAALCYELFRQSGKIGFYGLYKKLDEKD